MSNSFGNNVFKLRYYSTITVGVLTFISFVPFVCAYFDKYMRNDSTHTVRVIVKCGVWEHDYAAFL
jgi:hypothetical protein